MKIGDNKVLVFTDGSSLGNPGPGGYGAVIVSLKLGEVIELGGGKPNTTNNEMELSATIAALSYLSASPMPIDMMVDSQYVNNGITKWVKNWEKNGWQTQNKEPVSHQALWKNLLSITRMIQAQAPVTWNYVPGHVGVHGNERADEIATSFASAKDIDLFRGSLHDYPIDILNFDLEKARADKKDSTKKKTAGKAYLYLSLIDGDLQRHKTWAECEARVKGKDAKFRKALSPEHEQEILAEWGVAGQ